MFPVEQGQARAKKEQNSRVKASLSHQHPHNQTPLRKDCLEIKRLCNAPVKTTRKISNKLYQGELPMIFDW